MKQLLFVCIFALSLFAADHAVAKESSTLIYWEDLLPPGYDADAILEKHQADLERLDQLPDESEEGQKLLQKILDSFNASPMNQKWNHKPIRLDGFLAPLDIENGKIVRFLLVPYFGACIHVPPPPTNQTVLIETAPGQAIPVEQADYAFVVEGTLEIESSKTDIGSAGYRILNAKTTIDREGIWLEPQN
ncbi:DUF3299 domain-containing protein [Thiomicrorhabdus sp.]|uniref:DUF3299 domain-containing protein n=1 Tax=Thiomicrorhabdus sp. TaxID=2039724 RepID=UPI0029C8FAB1|nr:DUF3299 domain-containing protein [Thiomicrorhabdus sp.]